MIILYLLILGLQSGQSILMEPLDSMAFHMSKWNKMNCELIYDTPTYMFNVHQNQPSRQTGSRNLMGPKTLTTIYRYPILWEAFFDPSDSYFLFADLVGFLYTFIIYAHFSQQLLTTGIWYLVTSFVLIPWYIVYWSKRFNNCVELWSKYIIFIWSLQIICYPSHSKLEMAFHMSKWNNSIIQ
jgi:hypothetical protein